MDLLADPYDRAPLRRDLDLLRNDAGVWPVLGGVPVVVPDPARWLAARREHVLAALAEAGRADPETVRRLDAFTHAVRGVGRVEVADDFVEDEEPTAVDWVPGEAEAALRALLGGRSLSERLAADVTDGPVLEVGCGAGTLTRRIVPRPLVVVDLSLRAVLRATAGTDAVGVVGDAHALPVTRGAFGTVVAANLLDLVDDPPGVVDELVAALRPGGRLVCCTPDPALGIRGTDEALIDVLEDAGLRVTDDEDGIPWLRIHGPRHVQVYTVRRVVARRSA
ncbi:MAG: class I SAM-dependent methyltransferase [Myxococcota bacterium]